MCVHTPCTLRCLRHDPTAPWTPGRTCRLPGPPGNSPAAACHGPHHALNRTGVAADRLTLCAPCMSTVPVQCRACPMTPPRHGQQAGHAGYRGHQGTAHRQPATDLTTPSTAPEWFAASRRLYVTFMSTVPVQCGARPTTPPRHGQQAGHAGYRGHQETVHQQPATDPTMPSTAPEWLRPADASVRHVCPQSLCTAVRLPPLHALATPRIICYAGSICVHRLTLQSLCV